MSWKCSYCGFEGNDDSSTKCVCGLEVENISDEIDNLFDNQSIIRKSNNSFSFASCLVSLILAVFSIVVICSIIVTTIVGLGKKAGITKYIVMFSVKVIVILVTAVILKFFLKYVAMSQNNNNNTRL